MTDREMLLMHIARLERYIDVQNEYAKCLELEVEIARSRAEIDRIVSGLDLGDVLSWCRMAARAEIA